MAKRSKKAATSNGGSVVDQDRYADSKMKYRDPETGRLRSSAGCGDAVAIALLRAKAEGVSLEKIVRDNPSMKDKVRKADGYVNPGQYRMAVGSVARALVRAGEHVTIGDITVKSLEQRVALPEVGEAPERKTTAKKKAGTKKGGRRKKVSTSAEAAAAE